MLPEQKNTDAKNKGPLHEKEVGNSSENPSQGGSMDYDKIGKNNDPRFIEPIEDISPLCTINQNQEIIPNLPEKVQVNKCARVQIYIFETSKNHHSACQCRNKRRLKCHT